MPLLTAAEPPPTARRLSHAGCSGGPRVKVGCQSAVRAASNGNSGDSASAVTGVAMLQR